MQSVKFLHQLSLAIAVSTAKNLPYNEVSKYANVFRLGSFSVQNFTLVPFEASDISQDRQARPGLSLSLTKAARLAWCQLYHPTPLKDAGRSRTVAALADWSNHHFIEVTTDPASYTERHSYSQQPPCSPPIFLAGPARAGEEDQKIFPTSRARNGYFLGLQGGGR